MGQCFQWKTHVQRFKGDSCSFSHDNIAFGDSGGGQRQKKDDRLLPHQIRRRNKTDGEGQKSCKESKIKKKRSSDKRSEIPSRFKFCKKKPSCKFWYPPVCQKYKSEKDVCLATNVISDMLRQKESPTKGQRTVVQKRHTKDDLENRSEGQ